MVVRGAGITLGLLGKDKQGKGSFEIPEIIKKTV